MIAESKSVSNADDNWVEDTLSPSPVRDTQTT